MALGALTVGAVAVAVTVVGSSTATGAQERTVPVTRGVVQSTVSGSGNLSPANQQELSFGTSGQVVRVYVKEGRHVHEGQLLARLDDSSAKVDLAQARADLQSAQDTLSRVGTASTATAATAAAAVATAAVTTTPTTTTPTTTTPTTTTPTTTTPTTTTPTPTTPTPTTTTPKNTAPTTTTPSRSSGSGNSANGSSGSGQSSGSGGGSNQSTTTPAAAQAGVDSAELAVKSAETALAATRLRAPMPATVAAVNGAVGDTVGSGSSSASSSGASGSGSTSGFITLAQLSRYRMDVALSESDIGKVKVGQPATVTVNASGDEFAGHVTEIGVLSSSSSSSSSSGNGASGNGGGSSAVSYPVTITLDQTESKLKAGMSASADIVTAQASGITVPTQALQGSTVTLVRNGKHVTQTVQTGIAGDTTTQILSGLKVGDQVVVRSSSAVAGATATGGNSGARGRNGLPGGGFGGGGFGGGGNFRALRGAGGP